MKILVCDDVEDRGRDTAEQVESAGTGHDVCVLPPEDLAATVEALVKRGEPYLNGGENGHPPVVALPFAESEVDLLILDNNLAHLRIPGARHTAEALAGHFRAFTEIPYVVSLNKNRYTDFDLRFLVGDYQTATDSALNDEHLSNRGLWFGPRKSGEVEFRPWYWPTLNMGPDRRRRQVEFVERRLDRPLLPALGFSREVAERLSLHARGALSPDEGSVDDLMDLTFLEFFLGSCRSLPIKAERENVAEALRKSSEGSQDIVRRVVARVVAGELERWFRRDLLAPQDVLVDVPHLVARMPFLLGGGAESLDAWNACVSASAPPYGLEDETYRRFVGRARWRPELWTGRPLFSWPKLDEDRELNEMFYADQGAWASAVFCEDLSLFRPFHDGDSGRPREFEAEFEGSWCRRYVAQLPEANYTPLSRFALV